MLNRILAGALVIFCLNATAAKKTYKMDFTLEKDGEISTFQIITKEGTSAMVMQTVGAEKRYLEVTPKSIDEFQVQLDLSAGQFDGDNKKTLLSNPKVIASHDLETQIEDLGENSESPIKVTATVQEIPATEQK